MKHTEMLRAWGFKPHHNGTRMLAYAAGYAAERGMMVQVYKEVYPATAKAFGVTPAAVESRMRYAAKQAGDERTAGEIIADLAMRGVRD